MAAIRGRSAGSASRTFTCSIMMCPMIGQGIVPDTKDWTWVLRERCPDCGYDASSVAPGDLGPAIRDNAQGWLAVLAQPGATDRPDECTWSPLEYACHVRDVHRK